ncbi:MAG: response regulator, partial [Deltaproteobacteria bacterium]|nr:response regulator [Deltaproteobacteria bacterium]
EVFERFRAGESIDNVELQMKHADSSVVDVSLSVHAKRDAAGAIVESRAIVVDISERKRLQAQIAQSDRLSSMGVLAAGVGHEINNPLSYVLYNLQTLRDDLPLLRDAMRQLSMRLRETLGSSAYDVVMGDTARMLSPMMLDDMCQRSEQAAEGCGRIRDITRSLRSFTRVGHEHTLVNLQGVMEGAISMAFNQIKHRARLVKTYGRVSGVMADEGRLSQVFLNVLINAAHAIVDGEVEGNEIKVRTWQEGAEVCVEVSDTGQGIAPGDLDKVFEPFFTTKAVGLGSGLGLSISQSIIEACGGTIEVRSELGEGASFTIRLPAETAEDGFITAPFAHSIAPRSGGRVLIVDDERGIRDVIVHMLRGHEVVEAESGAVAKVILENDQGFDLILCDVMMPNGSGIDLHAWLACEHPFLAEQLVFISGGAFTARSREYLSKVENLRLEKPFEVDEFKTFVSDWLENAEESRCARSNLRAESETTP